MIRVSVILTTYNSASFLTQTLESVLSQDGIGRVFDLEFIIVDDCSTDNTTEILKLLNLPFISTGKNSGGPNKGRNIGLNKAGGDYICFIDHDDIWAKSKIIKQLKAATSAPIVSSGFSVHYLESGKIVHYGENTGQIKFYDRNITFQKILSGAKSGQTMYFSTLMINSSLKSVVFEEEFGKLDFDWLLRLLENRASAEVSESLMKRVVYGENLSLNENYRRINYEFSVKSISGYRLKFPKLVNIGLKRINGSMARYYYLTGELKKSRSYLRKSVFDFKTIFLYLTSFAGSKIVRKKIRIFG